MHIKVHRADSGITLTSFIMKSFLYDINFLLRIITFSN